jgi:drug/metabolite transporter (DMT)-like permease
MKKYTGEGILLFVTLIWGATFFIIKVALQNVSPILFVTIRFSFATLLFLPFMIRVIKSMGKEVIIGGILLGLMYFLGFATQTVGLKYTTATKSGFITGSFIIFTPVFQLMFEKKKPSGKNLLGVLFVILGLIFLSSKGSSILDIFNEIGSGFNIGDFFTLLCAIFYAMYLVSLDIISKKHNYLPLVFLQISVTAVCGLIFTLLLSATNYEPIKFTFNNNVLFAFLYTAILATILTTTLQTKYQKIVTPTKAGIIFSFEPIFAALFAYLVINERISHFGFLGGILIFTGLLVTELFDKKKLSNV